MADLSTTFCGIQSPNPFWLASAPPTDKAYNVRRAFEAGWGGVVSNMPQVSQGCLTFSGAVPHGRTAESCRTCTNWSRLGESNS